MSSFAEGVIIIGLILATINEYTLRKELKKQKETIFILTKALYFSNRKVRQESSNDGNQRDIK